MPVKRATTKKTNTTKKATIPPYESELENELYDKALQAAYAKQAEIYGMEGLLYSSHKEYKQFAEMLSKLDMTVATETATGFYEAHLLYVATHKPYRGGYREHCLAFKYNLRHTKDGESEAKIVVEVLSSSSVADAVEEIASMLSAAVANAYEKDYKKAYGLPDVILD